MGRPKRSRTKSQQSASGSEAEVAHAETNVPDVASEMQPTNIDSHRKVDPLLHTLVERSVKRTHQVFLSNYSVVAPVDAPSQRMKLSSRYHDEWEQVKELPDALKSQKAAAQSQSVQLPVPAIKEAAPKDNAVVPEVEASSSMALQLIKQTSKSETAPGGGVVAVRGKDGTFQGFATKAESTALVRLKDARKVPTPKWHAPWKLMRVISGHLGPVRSVAVDAGNEWFATGAGDRLIKIWDMASGTLKLSLTGHISPVRGLAISPRHPYLFSCGEDKMVKCWDLEQNKVIRHYHGHLSGVYSLAIHPTLDLLVTTGRDATARVWDMRTRTQVFALTGHSSTVFNVLCQEADPQIITCSADSTVRLWDLAAGKSMTTLTHHKKSVRALAASPNEFSFVSGSPDNIKQFKCPNGNFVQNFSGHNAIINTMSVNRDNVLFSGGDNGSMYFWDYKTGYNFQTAETIAQPGSLESETGIYCSAFDNTGLRLITGEADKSIKIWKEDENASPETHPIKWKPKLR